MDRNTLAKYIDQTLLSATATEEQMKNFILEAKKYSFMSVCVNQNYVPFAAELLKDSDVKVCTVIDFPLGAGGLETKLSQADLAITQGANELDFVVNMSLVKDHKWAELEAELTMIVKSVKEADMFVSVDPENASRKGAVVTKLILETCYLTDEEIVESSKCAKKAGFDFVKTSTGFAIVKDKEGKLLPNGATVHAVELMRGAVGPEMGVKASGGVHNCQEALDMIKAGATRIGASAGVQIVEGL